MILLRCLNELHPNKVIYKKGTPDEKTMAVFKMDDMVKYAELMPDDILPLYNKKTTIHQQRSFFERNQAGRIFKLQNGIYPC